MTGSGLAGRRRWRRYALSLLVLVTVAAVVGIVRSGEAGRTRPERVGRAGSALTTSNVPPVVSGVTRIETDVPGPGAVEQALAPDALPPGPDYTRAGVGTFRVVPGTGPVAGHGTLHRYSVEVENGITGVDVAGFASTVQSVLSDPRSWIGHQSGIALQRVDSGSVDFRVTLTSAMTVRHLCGYEQAIETSCFAPDADRRVALNVARWVRGDAAYLANVDLYRIYLINHEDGHALGHQHAHQCLANGLAPVMMQQTIGLKSVTGQMCQDNVWPYPDGTPDAPGAEQPDTAANDESVLIGAH